MSLVVEIFRSDDYVPDREIPLVPLLRALFTEVIGDDATGVIFELYFYQIEDLTPDRGSPSMENLRSSHGFVQVRIVRDGKLLYRHPHPVRELIGEPLRLALRKREPEVTHWGYGVRGPGLESITLSRPAPRVTHEMRGRSGPWPRLRLSVEEVPEPDPPETTLAALGVLDASDGGLDAALGVLDADDDIEGGAVAGKEADEPDPGPPVVIAAAQEIIDRFVRTHLFSDEIEEGGFLAGPVYRDAERPGGYLVHVTAMLPAERTGASMINFTFTGESFLRVSQQLERRGDGEKLLGWYHTHLFGATKRLGLSSVDVELHRSTFRRPWQVAALVNITDEGRVLRFYHGVGDEMALVRYWPVPRDAKRATPAAADTVRDAESAEDAQTADDIATAEVTITADSEVAADPVPETKFVMTAVVTAERVLAWAAEPSGPVPVGPLWDVTALARPPGSARDAAGQLARQTAARLGAGMPPFSAADRPEWPRIGLGAVFLAAAAGGRQQAVAAALLAGAVRPAAPRKDPGCWYDLVARHGVAGAVVPALAEAEALSGRSAQADNAGSSGSDGNRNDGDSDAKGPPPEPLHELMLAASPLTAVLYRPPLRALRSDTTTQAVATVTALLARPRGQAVLAAGLAGWTPHPHVLAWRASLLSRLRLSHRDLLLDVYLIARTRFAADWDKRISWAATRMSATSGARDPLAVDTLKFWAPLASIDRDVSLSALRPLMDGRQDRAIKLVRRHSLDRTGAA